MTAQEDAPEPPSLLFKAGVVDFTSASVTPLVRGANVKSKTALLSYSSYSCRVPLGLTFAKLPASKGYEYQNRDADKLGF